MLMAIDPGTEQSAIVGLDQAGRPMCAEIHPNGTLLALIHDGVFPGVYRSAYVEMIASYGMPVGREVFETVVWVGRFMEALETRGATVGRIYRSEVKSHLCRSQKANDATIRQALLDRYGPGKEKAVGRKASPGPLYGIKGDMWAALAVAVTGFDRERAGRSFLEGAPRLELVA